MKMNKKKIAVVSLVLCVLAVISFGSLAWFTAEDYVDNTLKFVTNFQMDLIEHNAAGKVIGKGDNHAGITFKNVKPGSVLKKDPTVINKSKNEEQWIRMTVKVDQADEWGKVVAEGTDLTTIFTGFDSTKWTRIDEVTSDENDNITATFYLKEKLEAGNSQSLFTGIMIPKNMTLAQAQALDTSTITVRAEAVQSDAGSTVFEAFGVATE